MAKHLSEFVGWLDKHSWPRVACPTCVHGGLAFVEGSMTNLMDNESTALAEQVHKGLIGPEELAGTFHGHLLCDNTSCAQTVSIAGDWQYVVNDGDHPEWGSFGDIYRIRYVNPPLQLIDVPAGTPEKVKDCITAASTVLWSSPSSAANQLRQVIEELLTARKIKRYAINKKKRRRLIALDSRIAIFGSSGGHPEVAETLLAVKWIGNNGSHDNSLNQQQVMVGAEILEAAIKALYDKTEVDLRAKVKAINKSKGLPKVKM